MHRRTLGLAVALATLGVGATGEVLPPSLSPPATDDELRRRRARSFVGADGVPFPELKHVARETVNAPRSNPERVEKRERRKASMQLRKRRGWR